MQEKLKNMSGSRGGTYPSTGMYINEDKGVGVIGIQLSSNGGGNDMIYLFTSDGKEKKIIDERFKSGRLWPTGISEDGKKVFYTIKDESGGMHKKEYNID